MPFVLVTLLVITRRVMQTPHHFKKSLILRGMICVTVGVFPSPHLYVETGGANCVGETSGAFRRANNRVDCLLALSLAKKNVLGGRQKKLESAVRWENP